MKKTAIAIISVLTALLLVVSLAGCEEETSSGRTKAKKTEAATEATTAPTEATEETAPKKTKEELITEAIRVLENCQCYNTPCTLEDNDSCRLAEKQLTAKQRQEGYLVMMCVDCKTVDEAEALLRRYVSLEKLGSEFKDDVYMTYEGNLYCIYAGRGAVTYDTDNMVITGDDNHPVMKTTGSASEGAFAITFEFELANGYYRITDISYD